MNSPKSRATPRWNRSAPGSIGWRCPPTGGGGSGQRGPRERGPSDGPAGGRPAGDPGCHRRHRGCPHGPGDRTVRRTVQLRISRIPARPPGEARPDQPQRTALAFLPTHQIAAGQANTAEERWVAAPQRRAKAVLTRRDRLPGPSRLRPAFWLLVHTPRRTAAPSGRSSTCFRPNGSLPLPLDVCRRPQRPAIPQVLLLGRYDGDGRLRLVGKTVPRKEALALLRWSRPRSGRREAGFRFGCSGPLRRLR